MADDRLDAIVSHLEATGGRPVDRTNARWLGEAEAIAADAADADLTGEALAQRLDQLAHLLGEVESLEDESAADHLAAARELLSVLRDSQVD